MPQKAGNYWWVASYNSGDNNNSSASGKCGDTGETSTVKPAVTSIVTLATDSVLPGSISDSATVSGLTSDASGSVTFTAYGPSASADCTASPVAFTTQVNLGSVKNGVATASSGAFNPSAAGTYWWVASYSGDNNNTAVSGKCGDLNESSSVSTPATPGLTKTADPVSGSNVSRGQQIDYTVTLSNTGDVAISQGTVFDVLPDYVTLVNGSISDGGVFSNGQITWTVDVPGNSSVALTYSVTVNSDAPNGQQLVNNAYFGEELNASTTHTVVVPPPPPPGTAGLTITKAVSPAETANVNYGDTLTYTMTVTATGTLGQSNVTVTDHVPGYDPARTGSGLTTYKGDAACDGNCTVSYDSQSHLITWNLGSMTSGQVRTVTFSVTIDTPAKAADGSIPSEEILNAAAVGSSQVATLPSNEVKNVVTAVQGIKIVKPSSGSSASTLPKTGPSAPLAPLAATAILLLGIGVGLTVAARRRTE